MVEDTQTSHPPSRAIRYGEYVYPLGEGVKGEWPEAPAETLRLAAEQIRADHPWDQEGNEFYTAVADWLEAEARHIAETDFFNDCTPGEQDEFLIGALATARAYVNTANQWRQGDVGGAA